MDPKWPLLLNQGDKPLECTPVHVEVYYSGVNAQSRRFFIDQLLPTFSYLRERLSIELIPYGLADATSNITEECSTRDLACTVNTLQACAIDKFFKDEVQDNSIQWDGKNQTLAYIYCMFKNEESQGRVDIVDRMWGSKSNRNFPF